MAKSAFSTLPHRQSLDIYDDEASPSLSSSRGGGGSSYNSRGNNNRPVSQSSSIHSHLSGQSSHSQNSYSRQVTKRFANNKSSMTHQVGDESDHSMDSILSGQYLELLAIDDSWSDRLKFMKDISMDDGVQQQQHQPRDASPSVGDRSSMFQYKLFDLDGLGIFDDNEDEYADDEASLPFSLEERVEIIEQDRLWWIQHFEEEGLFEHDTSAIYSRKCQRNINLVGMSITTWLEKLAISHYGS